jgi:hypothetical protein
MVISNFEQRLFTKLSRSFEPLGFELLIEKKQLRRPLTNGDFESIIFSVSPYEENDYWIETNFGVRKEQVETLVQQFLTNRQDFQDDTMTWNTSIGKFKGLKYFRHKVKNNLTFNSTIDEITDFFVKSGLPFMEKHRTFAGIDSLFNPNPETDSRFIYNQVHRCFKGLATAKLLDSTDFHSLIDTYRFNVIKLGNDEEIERFEQFVSFLLYYNPN